MYYITLQVIARKKELKMHRKRFYQTMICTLVVQRLENIDFSSFMI